MTTSNPADSAGSLLNVPAGAAGKSERILASRVAMMPRDTNGQGHIFGGVLLSLIDLAGADIARYACKGKIHRVVTRAMDQVEFRKPVLVNDIVTCYAQITRVGKSSISVHVDVDADRHGQVIPVTEANLVYVAVDENDSKVPISCGQETGPGPVKAKPEALALDPRKRVLAMRKMMMPADTNGMGNIFGGVLLSFIDQAGSYVARRACANGYIHRCVTRFMDRVEFKKPVHVNDVITCWATVTKMGNTSVTVHVDVEADRKGETIQVTSADLVFVALDETGAPTSVTCSPEAKPRGPAWRRWLSSIGRWWTPSRSKGCDACGNAS
jgi:acyl-CoA thioesterase YciA